MKEFDVTEQKTMRKLEDIRHVRENGVEYWLAREIQGVFGYVEWRNFNELINRAKDSCASSGGVSSNHFVDITKMVATGSGASRNESDVVLSRYACYLVAMNGDPTKPEIASAQAYFAIQTRKQEIFDQLGEVEKRAALRDRVKSANKHLGDAAKGAGVQDYASFHNAGLRGLYGGLGKQQIMQKKILTSMKIG